MVASSGRPLLPLPKLDKDLSCQSFDDDLPLCLPLASGASRFQPKGVTPRRRHIFKVVSLPDCNDLHSGALHRSLDRQHCAILGQRAPCNGFPSLGPSVSTEPTFIVGDVPKTAEPASLILFAFGALELAGCKWFRTRIPVHMLSS